MTHRILKVITASLALLLCAAGCTYASGYGGITSKYRSISVPYVKGDISGMLTNAIVRQFCRSGGLEYRSSQADLYLKAEVIQLGEENIGFRYDEKQDGKKTNSVVPAETRLFAVLDVTVVDASTCCVVIGPVRIRANVDFDHDYYDSQGGINVFSLGQFSDYEEAKSAAKTPLAEEIAKKVVDYVNNCW